MFRVPRLAIVTVALLLTLVLVTFVTVPRSAARESIETFSKKTEGLYESDEKAKFKAAAIDAMLAALNLQGAHDDSVLQAAKATAVDAMAAVLEELRASPNAGDPGSLRVAKATIVGVLLQQLGMQTVNSKSDDAAVQAAEAIAADALFTALENLETPHVRSDHASPQENEDVIPEPDNLLYIACLSAPGDHARRKKIRETWMTRLRQEHGPNVRAEFVVGHNAMAGKKWCLASKVDQAMEASIEKERKTYGDIKRVALPEATVNLPDKSFQAFQLGVDARYKFIVRIEDDMELDYVALIEYLRSENSRRGLHLDLSASHSGQAYLLSFGLAHKITTVHSFENLGYLRYGSVAEDVNMRKWAAHEINTDFKVWDKRPIVKKIAHGHSMSQDSVSDVAKSPYMAHPEHALPDSQEEQRLPDPDKLLYIAVQSRPDGLLERTKARQTWMTQLWQQYGEEARAQFIFGHRTMQGDHVPYEDHVIEMMIATEMKQFGDIKRIPLPESYASLPDKSFLSMRLGVDARYRFILKIDVDFNLHYTPLIDYLKAKDPKANLYMECAKYHMMPTKPFMSTQIGADGKYVQYAGGAAYVLSFDLARRVTKLNASENLAYLGYGTTSEDLDMGRWVHREKNMEYDILYELHDYAQSFGKDVPHTETDCNAANAFCANLPPIYCTDGEQSEYGKEPVF